MRYTITSRRIVRRLQKPSSSAFAAQFPAWLVSPISGGRAGTRELVVQGTPFVVIYRVGRDHIAILAIHHGARKWSSAFDT